MQKRIACVQSNYIPWKGYFDLIRQCDLFVLYDCVQYTSRDWRNRNQIKTPQGLHWLTIPVHSSRDITIYDVECSHLQWPEEHWKTLHRHYANAPGFADYGNAIETLYRSCRYQKLSDINLHFLQGICAILDIATPMVILQEHIQNTGDKTDKLVAVCKHFGATHYLSGPSAKEYIEIPKFSSQNIDVEWMRYDGYPEYPQPYPPFTHFVSILDVLFNTGRDWPHYLSRNNA